MTPAEINAHLAKYTELFALSLGAKPATKGWTLAIGEEVVEIHAGFRRGQWTYHGETRNDLLALMAMRDGLPIKDVVPACLMFLAEQGVEILDDAPVTEGVREIPHTSSDSNSEPPAQRAEPDRPRSKKPEPRQNSNGHMPDINRLLPQDVEAERGVLSCMLRWPDEVIPRLRAQIDVSHFHVPANRLIFTALLDLYFEAGACDVITLTSWLRDGGELDDAGGPAGVTELQWLSPSPEMATSYSKIVREQAAYRRLAIDASEVASLAYGARVPLEELAERIKATGEAVRDTSGDYTAGVEVVSFKDLMAFDAKEDPDEVLGYRWLCRGGVAMWVGQSGIGKSAITMQSAMFWGMGQPLWGVKTSKGRRLKSLIIQAENDRGDMAEMAQGVMAGFGTTKREEIIDTWNTQIVFARVTVQTGPEFGRLADRLIRQHKPDLVWVDPLLSFVGGDLSKQEVASQFMRHIINPIAFDTGVVWMLLHHTGKPSSDPKAKSGWTDHDFAYQAFGSSELVNSARAVNVLSSVGNGTYELKFAKRGKRAGALTLPDDEGKQAFTDVLYLQHAKQGIFWEQAGQMTAEEIEQAKPKKKRSGAFDNVYLIDQVTDRLETHSGIKPVALMKEVIAATGMAKATFYRLIGQMKIDKKIIEKGGELFLAKKIEKQ